MPTSNSTLLGGPLVSAMPSNLKSVDVSLVEPMTKQVPGRIAFGVPLAAPASDIQITMSKTAVQGTKALPFAASRVQTNVVLSVTDSVANAALDGYDSVTTYPLVVEVIVTLHPTIVEKMTGANLASAIISAAIIACQGPNGVIDAGNIRRMVDGYDASY